GRFNLNGDATVNVNRKTNTAVTLLLHADLNSPTDQITGSVSDGNWRSELNGDRNVFDPVAHPASQAGVRAFVLTSANISTNAAEGLGKIARTGATRVRGRLDDGRVF